MFLKKPELSSKSSGNRSENASSQGLKEHTFNLFFFFGLQTEHTFYSSGVLFGFCNVSISCHLTVKACQISLHYWLFAWINLKRRSLISTKYNLLWSKWVSFLGVHLVRMLKTTRTANKSVVKNVYWHFIGKNYPERVFQ